MHFGAQKFYVDRMEFYFKIIKIAVVPKGSSEEIARG